MNNSNNKDLIRRLKVYHEKFSTYEKFSWEELKDACESEGLSSVSRRTIIDDIQFLREVFQAPIPFRKRYYYYERPYVFLNILDEEEADELGRAFSFLVQFTNLPFSDKLLNVIDTFRLRVKKDSQPNFVFLEQNELLVGLTFLAELYNYIEFKNTVLIHYQDFAGQNHDFTLHPYFLKEYNNRWYVFGLEETHRKIFNLALDRITSIDKSSVSYIDNAIIDPNNYFRDFIGVTKVEAKKERICLRILKPRAYYVSTKPLHYSQKIVKETAEYIEIELKLLINKELESKILELGADGEVIRPHKLRAAIASMVKAMADKYA